MNDAVFISICIPAYKHVDYLKRLLDSIAIQTFKDYEVVITDDSPGNEVEQLCLQYTSLPMRYIKNEKPLGSPENWNAGIRNAKGEWVKMMHDDDWFSGVDSLEMFARVAKANKDFTFIFSDFIEVDEEKQTTKESAINNFHLRLLKKSPLTLFKKNFVGHPSTTLIRNNNDHFYDNKFKWVVDMEFYIRYLNIFKNFVAIRKPLVNIGIGKDQITKQVFRNPTIEIPEVLELYKKLPPNALKNVFCYDYYWRFVRNMQIRTEADIRKFAPDVEIPVAVKGMIQLQQRFSLQTLKIGFWSKLLMLRSYVANYRYL
jgi:glycosyltransferase involved in cell wall biosynthesis